MSRIVNSRETIFNAVDTMLRFLYGNIVDMRA